MAYLTPPTLPATTYCRRLLIPDSPEWIGLVSGVLLPLIYEYSWKQEPGGIPVEEARARWEVMLNEFWEQEDCMSCLCEVRYNPATGRLSFRPTGSIDWYEVPDGPWVEPAPVVTYPAPQPRTEGTEDNRRCIASRNAALVVQKFYNDTAAIAQAAGFNIVLGLAQTIISTWVTTLGAGVGINTALEIAFDILEEDIVEGLQFGDEQVASLQCILYCASAIDEAGVVTFDYGTVISEMTADWFTGFSLAKILTTAFLGEEGLNVAGSIHNEDAADCSECGSCVPWCYYVNFGAEMGEWDVLGGTRVNGQGVIGGNYGSTSLSDATVRIDFPAPTFVSEVSIGYAKPNGSGANNVSNMSVSNGGTPVASNTSNPVPFNGVKTIVVNAIIDRVYFDLNSGNSAGPVAIQEAWIKGPEGEASPFPPTDCP